MLKRLKRSLICFRFRLLLSHTHVILSLFWSGFSVNFWRRFLTTAEEEQQYGHDYEKNETKTEISIGLNLNLHATQGTSNDQPDVNACRLSGCCWRCCRSLDTWWNRRWSVRRSRGRGHILIKVRCFG